MEVLSSSKASSSKTCRGCLAFGSIAETGNSANLAPGTGARSSSEKDESDDEAEDEADEEDDDGKDDEEDGEDDEAGAETGVPTSEAGC
jgi:hypothetical protein